MATSELEDAVNVAITLGRPLLLQGDPGAGKTRLAYALAYALGLPLEEAYVKSTTRAQDLLYTYDAVRRLYDAQFPPTGSDLPNARRPTDVSAYIRLGPLGRAIARGEFGRRSVVLIDEIDKADIDFPNDLLHELDQLAFDVTDEPGRRHTIPANRPDLRPIIIVTNNEEKTLPSAFLRRCIFHYLEFPTDPELLSRILDAHDPGHPEIRDKAVDVLLRLRELDLARRPGLSELLDWVSYLQAVQASPHDLDSLPHVGALLKQRGDQLRAEQLSPQQPNAGNGKTAPVSLP
ncbi:AAA family ATPase [Frankia sp. R82]|uniref:AAA family ATPase n=1 Tax=Frankia sp. R82 TaxID=2950553 RepID=UPI0035ABC8F5